MNPVLVEYGPTVTPVCWEANLAMTFSPSIQGGSNFVGTACGVPDAVGVPASVVAGEDVDGVWLVFEGPGSLAGVQPANKATMTLEIARKLAVRVRRKCFNIMCLSDELTSLPSIR